MKNLLRIAFLFAFFAYPLTMLSQTISSRSKKETRPTLPSSESSQFFNKSFTPEKSFPSDPLSSLVSIPGATSIGLSGKYYLQGYKSLHNIQVDPSNPMNVHAVVMTALNVKPSDTVGTQTVGAGTVSFPQRNVYYTFSSDGGVTWKTPKPLSTLRAGFMSMVLFKRNGVYVPAIVDHHFTSASVTDLFCSVYVESGNPGDGNFLVGDCDRITNDGGTGDIIWPTLAVSNDGKTLYVIASYSPPATAGVGAYKHLHFGKFSLDATTGKPSNWSGWQNGPDTSSTLPGNGAAYGQNYAISVSPGGKLGITWLNTDYTTPDYSMYFSESKDGGQTWSAPVNFFTNIQTKFSSSAVPDPAIYLRADGLSGGTDLFYDGENAAAVFAAYESTFNLSGAPGSTNTFVPASGTLLYWKTGMTNSVILVSQVSGDQTVLPAALDNGAFLSVWDTTHVVDVQEQNLLSPTVARTSDPKIWSILFEAWVNNDSATYTSRTFDNTADSTSVLPFHSIYRVTTTDNGASWVSAPVATNDMTTPLSSHKDYRFPEVSNWNPLTGGVTNYALFGADTAAGNWNNPRDPGFDEVGWFFKKDVLGINSVKTNITDGSIALGQNYPNPFSLQTNIPISMKNDEIVTITVSDVLGREMAVVYHGMLSAGEHEIPFTAANLGTGIYTYTLKTSSGAISRTMSLVK